MSRMPDLHISLRHRGRRFRLIAVLTALTLGLTMIAGAPPAMAGTTAGTTTGSPGVFAINQDLHTVIFAPAAGGPIRPVMSGLTNPAQIAVSRGGSLFIIDGSRLLKITPRGTIRTIRSGMTGNSTMAVDDNNWLFVHDGAQVVKYSPNDGSSPVAVGSGQGQMTLDGAGNVSLTAATPNGGDQTVITTLPVRGGPPQVRMLTSAGNNGLEDGYLSNVVEARDGTLYIEILSTGGSGASWIMRVKPGSANVAPGTLLPLPLSEYVYAVDPFNNFFVLQNRHWCTNPALGDGSCTEDYGVDAVQKFTSSGSTPASVPVTGLNIPAGGIAVAATGVVYAAVVISRSANPFTTTIPPKLVRINPAGGAPVIIATGHFRMPVAEDFNWYVN